jgi:uncharacterized protein
MKAMSLLGLLMAILLCGGCEASKKPAVVADPTEPTRAQPKLPTMKIYLASEEMIVELARTQQEQRTGMMFRTNMDENSGMLFPMPQTEQVSFWMKNCPLPLSAAYIDPEGIIQEIHEFRPHDTNGVASASNNIRFVLETPQGWFERHHIGVGVAVATERGPLMTTFFGKQ